MDKIIQISEFSRKFNEPIFSEKYQQYVSTSFNKEIGFRFPIIDIPQEIERAIISEDKLRIEDSYPLSLGTTPSFALVAREVSKYSILAVATCGLDDEGRPLICYRYFWLTNIDSPDFDGIGTLLKWWDENGRLKSQVKPHEDYKKEITELSEKEDFYFSVPRYKQDFQVYENQTQTIFNKISYKPYLFKKDIEGTTILPNMWGIHSLALKLKAQYENVSLAWAWNTSVIKEPSHFTLICSADNNSYEQQKKRSSSTEDLKIKTEDSKPEEEINDSEKFSPNYKKLKPQLINFVLGKEDTDTQYIFNCLEESDSKKWQYAQVIDATAYQNKLIKASDRLAYEAIILLLSPQGYKSSSLININIKDFIKNITYSENLQRSYYPINRQNKKPVIQEMQDACKTIKRFLSRCSTNIFENIYEIINQLLLWSLSESIEEAYLLTIQWFLVEPDLNLNNYFAEYARNLMKELKKFYQDPKAKGQNMSIEAINNNNDINEFCKELIKDLICYELDSPKLLSSNNNNPDLLTEGGRMQQIIGINTSQKTQVRKSFSKYINILTIFYLNKCFNSAALFSQLSKGYVSDVIYQYCCDPYEIIPLKKKINIGEIDSPSDNTTSLFDSKIVKMLKQLIIGMVLIGIGTGAGISIQRLFFSPTFTVGNNQEIDTFNNLFFHYRKLLEANVSWEDTEAVRNLLLGDLKKLNEKIPKMNDYPKEIKLRKKFIEEQQKKLSKLSAYSDINSLTPKVDKTLNQATLEEMTALKASSTTETTDEPRQDLKNVSAFIEPILKWIKEDNSFTTDKLSKSWDKESSDTLKEFQKTYNLNSTGNMDQKTWNFLYFIVKDIQVNNTAKSFENIIQSSQTSNTLEEKLTNIKNCNRKVSDYLECLTKVSNLNPNN